MTEEQRALVERAHQVGELTKHQGWTVLVDFVLHGPGGSAATQRRVVNGAASWDDYLKDIGRVHGIQFVVDAPGRLKTMAEAVSE